MPVPDLEPGTCALQVKRMNISPDLELNSFLDGLCRLILYRLRSRLFRPSAVPERQLRRTRKAPTGLVPGRSEACSNESHCQIDTFPEEGIDILQNLCLPRAAYA